MERHSFFSPKQDFAFIAGAPILGYLVLAALVFGPSSVMLTVSMILLFVLEGPHVFATATRSYLDKQDRNRLGRWRLLLIVPLCLIGPAMLSIGLAPLFYVLTVCWLHTHVAKQHVGFLALYKKKSGEHTDIKQETQFYKLSLYLPLIFFLLYPVTGNLGFVIGAVFCSITLSYYLCKEFERSEVNYHKITLLTTSVPLQWLAWLFAAHSPFGARAAGVVLAISHTIQYHRLMIAYHRTEAADSEEENKKPWHSYIGYAIVAISLNFLLYAMPKGIFDNEVILSALWGIPFQHYLLDGVIWKTRDYPIFRRAIGV